MVGFPHKKKKNKNKTKQNKKQKIEKKNDPPKPYLLCPPLFDGKSINYIINLDVVLSYLGKILILYLYQYIISFNQ